MAMLSQKTGLIIIVHQLLKKSNIFREDPPRENTCNPLQKRKRFIGRPVILKICQRTPTKVRTSYRMKKFQEVKTNEVIDLFDDAGENNMGIICAQQGLPKIK